MPDATSSSSDPAAHRPARTPAARPLRPHARMSLRWRLTFLFGLAFAATLLAMFITLHQLLVNTLLHDVDDGVTTDALRIAQQAADPAVLADPARLHDILRRNRSDELQGTSQFAAIRDSRGALLAAPPVPGWDRVLPAAADLRRARAGETSVRTVRIGRGPSVRVATAPIMGGGVFLGTVQAGESLQGLFSAGDRLQLLLILEGAVGLLIAGGVGYAFARRSLRPLDHVVAVAADIEANDLTRRLSLHRQPIEVQALADTFDAMLERIGRAFAQQRSFVLDVSHELRTPLTALRGNIDVLLMDPELPAGVRAQLERMSAETSRLIRLAANLLLLGQADTGKLGVMAPVELDLLCLEVVQQARSLKPSVRLRLGDEDQVTVLGDRDLLKQLLLNLVENGLTYTPPGGRVTLSLSREADHAAIEVRDSGVGIAPDDLPHVFERFYRVESSRRRATGGAGVGLAIVDWVARLHGGAVSVASEPGKGSSFTVRLPLRGAPAGPPAAVPAAANAAAAPEPAPAAPARG